MVEKNFRGFVRSTIALAFLPINQLEAAIDDLRDIEFDKESSDYDKMMEFKDSFLDYVERVWIHGNFPPKVWNHWKKPSNTTNNQNEG